MTEAIVRTMKHLVTRPGTEDPVPNWKCSVRLAGNLVGYVDDGTSSPSLTTGMYEDRYFWTDADGILTMPLQANLYITPAGTVWSLKIFKSIPATTFEAPDGTSLAVAWVGDNLAPDPTNPFPANGVTQSQLDGVEAELQAQLDLLPGTYALIAEPVAVAETVRAEAAELVLTGFVPVLAIDTAGGAPIVSEDIYLNCTATTTAPQGAPSVFTGAEIKGHGNSTWGQPKNPYKLKLANKAALLGMASAKNWIMLANYFDTSQINNATAYTIGSWMSGLDFTPHGRFAEVILNGVYVGLYFVTEDKELNAARVNQAPVSSDTGLGLTGCYLMEVDGRYPGDGEVGFVTALGTPFIFDDPNPPDMTQAAYFQAWMQNFENVLFGTSFLDPVHGYAPMIDMDSWADWYIVEELLANTDSEWYASVLMYKTRDTSTVPGILFLGPLWDFDLSFGLYLDSQVETNRSPTALYTASQLTGWPNYLIRMFQDPAFVTHVATRWNTLYATKLSPGIVYATIDEFLAQIDQANQRDEQAWRNSPIYSPQASYNRKTWLATRIAYLNTQLNIAPDPVTTTVTEPV